MRAILLILFIGLISVSCSSDRKTAEKSINDTTKKDTLLPFSGYMPVDDKLLKEPRMSNSGEISFYPEDPEFELFIENLKKWLKEDNRKKVIQHIYFPITLYENNKKVTDVHSPEEFTALYIKFWTALARKVVYDTQNARNCYRDELGYKLGTGEIWINKFRNDKNEIKYLITNINDAPAKPENQPQSIK
jgi:hypothetical protein